MIVSKILRAKTSTGLGLSAFILTFPTPHGDGRGLVNIFEGSQGKVFVLSEIRTNPIARVMDARVPDVAATLQNDLAISRAEQLTKAEWYAHHGAFSYHYTEMGPATFTTIPLRWDGTTYTDSVEGRRLLSEKQAEELIERLGIPPVEAQLKHLGEKG